MEKRYNSVLFGGMALSPALEAPSVLSSLLPFAPSLGSCQCQVLVHAFVLPLCLLSVHPLYWSHFRFRSMAWEYRASVTRPLGTEHEVW